MPSYNSGPFLREAVESALADSRVQLIIQDSLSDDETQHVLCRYSDDKRVLVNREKDDGQGDALNRAIAKATGDWIGWLNADDLYTEGSLPLVLDAIAAGAAEGCSIIYGDFHLVDHAGNILRTHRVGPWSWEKLLHRGCYVFSGATFIRRDELERIGGLDASLHFCMDLDLFLRLGPAIRSLKLEKPLGALRVHGASKSSTRGHKFAGEAFRVLRRHKQGPFAIAVSVRAYVLTILYVMAAPVRFSKLYNRVRRVKNS